MENIIDLPIQSEKIIDLIKALETAQKASTHVSKDAKNPYFKSNYTTYDNAVEHFIKFYSETGLSFSHSLLGNILVTTIYHSSGQWIRSYHPIVCAKPNDPQAFGSALTYGKRYSLMALAGMSSGDDDGEAAMPPRQSNISQPSHVKTQTKDGSATVSHAGITEAQIIRLKIIAKNNGWSIDDMKRYMEQLGVTEAKNLSWIQYEALCNNIEKFPKPMAKGGAHE